MPEQLSQLSQVDRFVESMIDAPVAAHSLELGAVTIEAALEGDTDERTWRIRSRPNVNALGPALDVWIERFHHHWSPIQVETEQSLGLRTIHFEMLLRNDRCGPDDLRDSVVATSGLARRLHHVITFPPTPDESGTYQVGYEDMLLTLASSGLPSPPVPEDLVPFVCRVADWFWTTESTDTTWLYHGESFDETQIEPTDESFAFAHGGHGLQSNFLMYSLRHRGVSFWARQGYGNAYGINGEHAGARSWITCLPSPEPGAAR